jgi:hypothetical protein
MKSTVLLRHLALCKPLNAWEAAQLALAWVSPAGADLPDDRRYRDGSPQAPLP